VSTISDLDIGAWIREDDIEGLLGSASVIWSVGNVGNKHIWKRIKDVVRSTRTANGNWSTVHVHLTVSNSVEPRPDEDSFTRLETVWKCNWDYHIRVVQTKVANSRYWAATFVRLNNLEDRVLSWRVVIGDGDLTRTAAVDSTTSKAKTTRLSWCEDVLCVWSSLGTNTTWEFAREVGTLSI